MSHLGHVTRNNLPPAPSFEPKDNDDSMGVVNMCFKKEAFKMGMKSRMNKMKSGVNQKLNGK